MANTGTVLILLPEINDFLQNRQLGSRSISNCFQTEQNTAHFPLNEHGNTNTETISAFRFRCYLVVSASQDAGGYVISRQNKLELHVGCHTCWLSYFTLVCLWCGRMVGRAYGHVITKISRMGRLPSFLTHGARFIA